MYDAEKDVKFLTYAGYHLKSCFYSVTKMTNGKRQIFEVVSLDDALSTKEDGAATKLIDTLADPSSEEAIDSVVEWDALALASAVLRESVDSLQHDGQRETVVALFFDGLSQAEYARRKGVSRQRVHQWITAAFESLRNDLDFVICA
jgi:DNA-directed RNA polymerase specialized sigma24 family protein